MPAGRTLRGRRRACQDRDTWRRQDRGTRGRQDRGTRGRQDPGTRGRSVLTRLPPAAALLLAMALCRRRWRMARRTARARQLAIQSRCKRAPRWADVSQPGHHQRWLRPHRCMRRSNSRFHRRSCRSRIHSSRRRVQRCRPRSRRPRSRRPRSRRPRSRRPHSSTTTSSTLLLSINSRCLKLLLPTFTATRMRTLEATLLAMLHTTAMTTWRPPCRISF